VFRHFISTNIDLVVSHLLAWSMTCECQVLSYLSPTPYIDALSIH
jgi:hypothetical protein